MIKVAPIISAQVKYPVYKDGEEIGVAWKTKSDSPHRKFRFTHTDHHCYAAIKGGDAGLLTYLEWVDDKIDDFLGEGMININLTTNKHFFDSNAMQTHSLTGDEMFLLFIYLKHRDGVRFAYLNEVMASIAEPAPLR